MESININIQNVQGTVTASEIEALRPAAVESLEKVMKGTGLGNDFLGWVNLPTDTTDALLSDIEKCAESLRSSCEVVVAIGIGGS